MKIEKPFCNFQNCKYHQDGNCVNASKYENCKVTDLHSEIARLRVDLDNARADTVRKMQELIKERCIKGGIYPAFVASTIDRVANEILESK